MFGILEILWKIEALADCATQAVNDGNNEIKMNHAKQEALRLIEEEKARRGNDE